MGKSVTEQKVTEQGGWLSDFAPLLFAPLPVVIMDLTSEHFDSLDLTIYQPKKGFRYGPESLALADLCRLKKNDIACELGAGSGVISCVLAKRDSPAKIVAVEIQEELCKIIQKNVNENHLQDIIECANADWRDYAKAHCGEFDVVFSNPPFFPVAGRVSPDISKRMARHEISGNLEELLFSAHELLKDHGHFFVVFDTKRQEEFKEKALINSFNINKIGHISKSEIYVLTK